MAQGNLYDGLIMDHIKNARNYRVLDDASHKASGSNALCGDELDLYLTIVHGRIDAAAFQCTCCGISMASASVMTEVIKHRSVVQARSLVALFLAAINGDVFSPDDFNSGQRAILKIVSELPARVRCGILPWATFEAALDEKNANRGGGRKGRARIMKTADNTDQSV